MHIDAVTQTDWGLLSVGFASLFSSHTSLRFLFCFHWWFLFMTFFFFFDLQKLVLFNNVIKSVCQTCLFEVDEIREKREWNFFPAHTKSGADKKGINAHTFLCVLLIAELWRRRRQSEEIVEIFLWTWKRFIGFSEMNLIFSFPTNENKEPVCKRSDKVIRRHTYLCIYEMKCKVFKVSFQWNE